MTSVKHPLVSRLDVARDSRRPLIIAHRGFSDAAVENTLPAFHLAVESGADGIELDLQLTRDGELCVFHDRDLRRLCGDARAISACDYADLRRLTPRVGSRPGGTIPRLEEIRPVLGDDTILDIELKSHDRARAGLLVQRVVAWVREHRLVDRVLVSSFDPRLIRLTRSRAREIAVAVIYSGDPEVPRVLRAGLGVGLARADIAKPSVETVLEHRRVPRRPYLAWTVVKRAEVAHLTAAGASGLITNDPVATRAAMEDAGR
jgi:glycerophosphoryl diester phosphodiesterase